MLPIQAALLIRIFFDNLKFKQNKCSRYHTIKKVPIPETIAVVLIKSIALATSLLEIKFVQVKRLFDKYCFCICSLQKFHR